MRLGDEVRGKVQQGKYNLQVSRNKAMICGYGLDFCDLKPEGQDVSDYRQDGRALLQ